jgi:hypothetical protein
MKPLTPGAFLNRLDIICIQTELMKICLLSILAFFSLSVQAQKNFSVSTSVNFNFGVSGIAINDAGMGVNAMANYFTAKKLQLRSEASLDRFIGDKQLFIDSLGNHFYGNPTMIGLTIGPEFVLTEHLTVSAGYGFASYKLFGEKIWRDKIKLMLTSRLGAKRKFLLGFNYSLLPAPSKDAHFYGISAELKIL